MLSDGVPCNNGNNWWYIVDYQLDGEKTRPTFIKTSKDILSYGLFQYEKNLGVSHVSNFVHNAS